MRHRFPIFALAGVLVCFGSGSHALMPPMPDWWDQGPGTVSAEWVAPYVQHLKREIEDVRTETLVWYRPDGSVLRELNNPSHFERSVTKDTAEGWDIYGIRWDGQLHISAEQTTRSPAVAVSRSGVHKILIERDVLGRRWLSSLLPSGATKWKRGPFRTPPQEWAGGGVLVGEDGWIGLITGTIDSLEAVLLDPQGREATRAKVENRVFLVAVGKNKILVRGMKFQFLRPNRSPVEFALDRGTFVLWLPHDNVGLFKGGDEDGYVRAVDVTSGRTLWSIPLPAPRCDWWPMSIEEIEGLLFVHAIVGDSTRIAAKEINVPRDVIVAHDASSGKRVARWQSHRREGINLDHRQGLQKRGDELWLVRAERFARIDLDDVQAEQEGWWKNEGESFPDPPLLQVPARSDVSWATAGPFPQGPSARIISSVRRQLGDDELMSRTQYERVRFQDAGLFGESPSEDVWLTTTPAIRIVAAERSDSIEVNLHLVILPKGDLLAAFTESQKVWLVSSQGYDDLPSDSQNPCEWELGSASDFQHSAVKIIRTVWEKWGIKPDQAGQIVLRPRIAECLFPARPENGRRIPVNPRGPMWFVDIRGTYIRGRNTWTGKRIAFSDRDLGKSSAASGRR